MNKSMSFKMAGCLVIAVISLFQMTPNDLQYLSGSLSIAVAFMIEQVPHLFQVVMMIISVRRLNFYIRSVICQVVK